MGCSNPFNIHYSRNECHLRSGLSFTWTNWELQKVYTELGIPIFLYKKRVIIFQELDMHFGNSYIFFTTATNSVIIID